MSLYQNRINHGPRERLRKVRFMTAGAALLSVVLSITLSASVAARSLGAFGEYAASVADDFTCGNSARIRIDAGSAEAFDRVTREMAQAVGLARTALGFECAAVKEIVLMGYYLGNHIAYTILSAEDGWVLSGFEKADRINSRAGREYTFGPALIDAAGSGELTKVRVLLDNNVDINFAKSSDDPTALMRASENNRLEVAKYLIERGANIDYQTSSGATALYRASGNGNLDIVKLLVAKGANIHIEMRGFSATSLARLRGLREVEQFLLAKGGQVSEELIQRQRRIEYDEWARPYFWLIKENASAGDRILRAEDRNIMLRFHREHYRIMEIAREASPINCFVETNFGWSRTICVQGRTADPNKVIEQIIAANRNNVVVDRRRLKNACSRELKDSVCECFARQIDGHFTETQYNLFLQSPKAFAAYVHEVIDDRDHYHDLGRRIIRRLAGPQVGRVDDVRVFTVWLGSTLLAGKCRDV